VAVTVGKLIERLKAPLQLEQLGGTDGHEREIENPDVSSPGLALAGYVGRFTAQRVQILGETEITYLSTLSESERKRILTQFFAFPIPCVFITKGLEAMTPLVDLAVAAHVPVLRSPLKTAEVYRLDRVLSSAVFYNFDYGFVEGTRSGDGDHLDALLIIDEPTFTGCHVWARPIGGLEMRDEKGPDFKVLCVAIGDPHQQHIERLEQVRPHRLVEIEQFFATYKALEDKAVEIIGWRDHEAALQVLRDDRETWLGEVEATAEAH